MAASFRCEPPLLAFSDFSTTEPLRQRLYIVNAAPVAQRFGATLLTGDADRDCWRLEVEPLGTVAPGLRQPVTVVFLPVDLGRRTAQIRVTAEFGPPAIVSATADPAASSAAWTPNILGAKGMRGSLPPRVDFGRVPLLRRAERPLTVFNEGVASVDYRVSFLKPHQEFSVEPTSGTVAPGSSVTFMLAYAPVSMTTGVAEILVATSLPGLLPAKITLSGASAPGDVREAALQEQTHARESQLLQASPLDEEQRGEGGRSGGGGSMPSNTASSPSLFRGGSLGTLKLSEHPPQHPSPPRSMTSRPFLADVAGVEDPYASQLLLRPGRGERYSRTDPGQLLHEERLQAFKTAQERKLAATLAARAEAREADAAMIAAGGAGEEEARLLLLARKHAARAEELAAGFVQIDGIRVPTYLHTTAGASYVLTQAPGRLKPKEIAIAVAQRKSQEAAAAAGQARMVALERKAAAAAAASATVAFHQMAAPHSPGGSDGDDGTPSPLQSTAGELRQNWRGPQDTASSPGLATQQQPWASRRDLVSGTSIAHPPPVAPTLHSIGARAAISAEFSSSPLYALLQDPASPSGTYALAPLIASLDATPPHEPLASGCTGLDDLVNGWLADANTAATGEVGQRPARTKPAIIGVSVDPRVLRQSLFQRAVADVATRERAIAFAAQEQRGETQLTPGEVAEIQGLRGQLLRLEHLVVDRARRTQRQALVVSASVAPGASLSLLPPALREPVLRQLVAPMAGLHPVPADVLASAWASKPKFSEASSEPFALRRDAAAAFRGAVTAHIIQRRAARRLRLLLNVAQQAEAEAGVAAPAPEELVARAFATPPLAADGEGEGAHDVEASFSSSFSSAAPALAALSRVRAAVQLVASRGEEHPVVKVLRRTADAGGGALRGEAEPRRLTAAAGGPLSPPTAAASTRKMSVTSAKMSAKMASPRPGSSAPALDGASNDFAARMARALRGGRINRALLYTCPADDAVPPPASETLPPPPASGSRAVGAPAVDVESAAGWWVSGGAPLPHFINEVAAFDDSDALWPEAEVRGYGPVALPAVPASYQPQELARPLRDGALHETAASGLMPYPWALPQYEAAIGEGPFSLGQPPSARPGAAAALTGAGEPLLALLATADAPHDGSAAAALPPAADRAARPLQCTTKLLAGAAVMLDQPPVHSRLRRALLPPALLPARLPVPRLMPVAVPRPPLRFWEAGIACALPGPPPEWLPAHFLWAPASLAQPFLWAYPRPPAWLVPSAAAPPPTGPPVLHGYRAFAARVPTMPPLALGAERFDGGGAPADGLVRDANGEVLTRSEAESWSLGGVGGALRCAHIGSWRLRPRDVGWSAVPPDLAAAAGVPPGMIVAAPLVADAEGGGGGGGSEQSPAGATAAAPPPAAAAVAAAAASSGAKGSAAGTAAGGNSSAAGRQQSPVRGSTAATATRAVGGKADRPPSANAGGAAAAAAAAPAAASAASPTLLQVSARPSDAWTGKRPLTRPQRLLDAIAEPPSSAGGSKAVTAAVSLPPRPLPLGLGLRIAPEALAVPAAAYLPTAARPVVDFSSRLLVPLPLPPLVDGRLRRETDIVPPSARGLALDERALLRGLFAGAWADPWPDVDAPSTSAPPAPRQAQTTTTPGGGGRWDDDSESDPDDEVDSLQDSKRRGSAAAAVVATAAAHGGGAGRRGSGGPGKAKPEAAAGAGTPSATPGGALLQASRLGGLSLDALVEAMLPHTAALARSRTFAVSSGAGAASPMAGASSPSAEGPPHTAKSSGSGAASAATARSSVGAPAPAPSASSSSLGKSASSSKASKDKAATSVATEAVGWGDRGVDGGWGDVALDATPTVRELRAKQPRLSPQEAAQLSAALYSLQAAHEWAETVPLTIAAFNAVITHPARRFIGDGNPGYGAALLVETAATGPHIARLVAHGAHVGGDAIPPPP